MADLARTGPGRAALRSRLQGARQVQEPVRPGAVIHDRVRGRGLDGQATPRGDRQRLRTRQIRGLHARGPVPDLPGGAAEARVSVGAGRRAQHRPGLRPVDRGVRAIPAGRPAERPGGADRRAGAPGDLGPARVPARRGTRLPLPGPARGDAVRGGGPTDPAGHPDRVRAGRRALRAGRAVDRAPPAGQPASHRHSDPAARPWQHDDRRGARRGHDRGGRLDRRHRAPRRRTRRPGSALRQFGRAARMRGVPDRGVPVGPPLYRGARDAPPGRPGATGERPGGAAEQPPRHRRQLPPRRIRRGRRSVRFGQVDAGQRHPLQRAGQPAQRRPARARPTPDGHRAGASRQGRARRPEPDRTHPPQQPGDLHGGLRPHPQTLRRDHRGEDPRLPTRPVQLQRQGRAAATPAPATARSRSR